MTTRPTLRALLTFLLMSAPAVAGAAPPPQPARPARADAAALLAPVPGVHGPALSAVTAEPLIRVRVRAAVGSATLGDASAPVVLRGGGPAGAGTLLPGPVTLVPTADAFVSEDATGARLRWPVRRLHAASGDHALALPLDGRPHPGTLTFTRNARAGGMDAVELVGLEAYLPGVLDRELYASWEPEAFAAQAVAARSYALWEIEVARGEAAAFDLEATTASQAYGGVAQNPKAVEAARATRGVVLAWGGRVLPAFYSSAVGGPGGDAAHTFPGRAPDIAPLRGTAHGERDAASPRFRWGPVSRHGPALARRIAAWGRRNGDPVAALDGLARIEPAAANRAGRLAAYRLHDATGAAFLLRADHLRHAANTPAAGLPPVTGDDRLFSGDFRVRRDATGFTFYGGRGFGHGVGLSQWGAEGMAGAGSEHREILATYYPGATLVEVY